MAVTEIQHSGFSKDAIRSIIDNVIGEVEAPL